MESEPSFIIPCSTAHQNARTKSVELQDLLGKKKCSACNTRLARWRQNGSQRSKCQSAGQSKSLICECLWDTSSVQNESEPHVIRICSRTCDFSTFFFFFFSLQEEQTVEGNLTHLLTLPHIRKKQKKPSASNLSKVWIIGGAASDHSCNFQTFTPTSRSDQASCEEVRKHPGSERLSSSLYL